MAQMTALRRRMIDDMTVRNLSRQQPNNPTSMRLPSSAVFSAVRRIA